ncbi:MAG: hypothetical protein GY722_12635, partial [bacterium]|nr:hypothetical protein [bacterium]
MSRLGAAVTLSASFSMARLAQRVLFAAAAWLLLASTGGAAGLTGETAARDAASPADYEAFLALQETPLQSADEELFLLGDAIWQRAYGETEFYLAPQIEDPHLYHARITSEDDKALGRAWSSLAFARIALSQRSLDLLTQMRVKVPEFVSESVVVLLPEIDLRRLTAEGIGITRLPEYGTEKAVLPEPSPSRSVIWSEDFETPFPGSNYLVGDLNSSDGTDTWDDVSCESYTGSESIWCADVGNYACTSYDDNMDAYVIKNGGVNVSGYDSVQFRFRKKYDTEAGYDKLWRSYSSNGSTWTLSSTYEGNSGGWTLSTITISNFSTYYWRFDFHSDDSVHEYEGAYLDTMEISGESTDFMEFSGTVRNSITGQGVSGASVSWGGYSTTTNSSGVYGFTNLPCETHTLTVSKSGYQTSSQTYTPICNFSNLKDVYLTPNVMSFGGTVRDSSNNSPISGASVSWGGYFTTTSSSGSYNFSNLPCGTYLLTVSKGGYQTSTQAYSPTCHTSNIKNVDLDPESMSFSGTVRDLGDDSPISGASVSWGGHSTTTNSSGFYSLSGLPCETHTLTVSKSGYQTYSSTYTPTCNSSNVKDVDLTPSLMSFIGTVRNASTGQPISGASVSWGGYSTTTSSSGFYSFSYLPCGTHTLTVSKSGYLTYSATYTPNCLQSNVKNVDLTPYSTAFSGTVRNADTYQGISGASVSWGSYSTTTSSSGSYSFADLPCESYTLTVSKSGYQTYSATYTPNCLQNNVRNVYLEPLTAFGGTVRDASNSQGISGASVSWGGYSTATSSSGGYSFINLPCETHTLTVSKGGYQTYSQSYTPTCLTSNIKNVDLDPNSTAFNGTVRNVSTNQGISGASVSWGGYSTTTNSSGGYSLGGLPCETHILTVSKIGYQTYSEIYTPACVTSNLQDVYLTPATTYFAGTVRNADTGQGVSGASVWWGGYSTTTSSSGGYSFTDLPCGTHTLTVSKSGYQTYSQTYTPTCQSSNARDVDLIPNVTNLGGTVRDSSTDQGIGGASVSWGSYSTTTSSSGGFSFIDLPCGTHTLAVSRSGYESYSQTYTPICRSSNVKDVSLTFNGPATG